MTLGARLRPRTPVCRLPRSRRRCCSRRRVWPDQNVKESFTGLCDQHEQRSKDRHSRHRHQQLVDRCAARLLLAILQEQKDVYKANQALLKALQKMPKVGYIRTPERLAWDVRYARENKAEDGGRRFVVATDRPVGFAEARNQPRSMDYPFTIIEMRLNTEDKGEGKLLYGTKLFIDQKTKNLVLENYAQQPIRFNEIKRLK